ncbi:phage protein Gp36 family protein [uncultured Alistipes sp.]|uniref:phage protein Gp36 family protein n=1 Tax=uncultured Alistipes sp. TaxID=538949 RepID=UPI0025D0844C|nr:phage protein Gp36 family protein [uncultured Alistipes sp.]
MAFLTPEELKTHLYKENIETIAREDETLVVAAIDAAMEEAYGYLGAYDRERIFAAEGTARNPLLLIFVKDIAVWHFINLCNAGTELELRQDRYERAVAWLRSVQRSETRPNLPAVDVDGDGKANAPAGEYIFGSNPKRSQQF